MQHSQRQQQEQLRDSNGRGYAGADCGRTGSAIPASETLFVGFWTNQGVADQATQKLLGS